MDIKPKSPIYVGSRSDEVIKNEESIFTFKWYAVRILLNDQQN